MQVGFRFPPLFIYTNFGLSLANIEMTSRYDLVTIGISNDSHEEKGGGNRPTKERRFTVFIGETDPVKWVRFVGRRRQRTSGAASDRAYGFPEDKRYRSEGGDESIGFSSSRLPYADNWSRIPAEGTYTSVRRLESFFSGPNRQT